MCEERVNLEKVFVKKFASATLALALAGSFATAPSADAASGGVKITNDQITPFAEDVGGGTWDYGTRLYDLSTKEAWSNYWHPDKNHGSTAQIGTRVNRACTIPGNTSYATVRGDIATTARAFWNTSCTP